jgi:GT2 family glycosyltransferase/CMP-N-acetylneuraminic acid synthetase
MPKASLIIRTRNEERWIRHCLESVFNQDFDDFEVILVDNESTDRTLELAQRFDVKLVSYTEPYFPGRALNAGIRASQGELLVMLSGHCIPTNPRWLGNLLSAFGDPKLAGVYGRQEPLPYTSDRDKRDLWTVFQLDRKVQRHDCFFHNANSAVRRDLWEQSPFSETATNIEDRIWARQMLDSGYHLIYEPDASVFHWHGIHQNDNAQRRRDVVRIIEHLKLARTSEPAIAVLREERPEIVAVIPVRNMSPTVFFRPLMAYTIERALECKHVTRVVVATDNPQTQELAIRLGAEAPFLRPPELSYDFVGVDQVVEYTLQRLAEKSYEPDWVLTLKETHPFRYPGLLDQLVSEGLQSGNDVIVPVHKTSLSLFKREGEGIAMVQDEALPADVAEPYYLGNVGLGKLTRAAHLLRTETVPPKMGIYVVSEQISGLMIRNQEEADVIGPLLREFWRNEGRPADPERLAASAE